MKRTHKRIKTRKGGGIKKTIKNLSKRAYTKYKKSKRNKNLKKQLKTYNRRTPFKPQNKYSNFETDAVERFSEFRNAMEELQKDYPLLLEEYIWYSTLTGDEKMSVKNKYEKAGFDRNLWLGVPDNEIVDYNDGTYGHPSVSWRCTLPGDGRSFHLSIGYSLSLQYFISGGEEKHWIPSRNACGPGTKIELRESKYWALLPLLNNIAGHPMKGTYPWNVPINDTDQCCFKHDQEYSIRGQSSQKIQMADWAMLYCIKHGQKSEGTEKIKDWLIKNTIQSKLGAEKLVNDGMFGIITEKVDSDEDLPKTYEEFERRTDEMLGKIPKSNLRTRNPTTNQMKTAKTLRSMNPQPIPKTTMKSVQIKSAMKTNQLKSKIKTNSNQLLITFYESLLRTFGGVVNVILSEEIPFTFDYYDSERANEKNKEKMRNLNNTEKINVMKALNKVTDILDKKPKKVNFKTNSEAITKSLMSYKNKTELPLDSHIELPKSIGKKLEKTAKSFGITPRSLLISAAATVATGGLNPTTIAQLATMATSIR